MAVVTGDAAHTMEQAVALHTGESDEDGILAGQHITPDSRKNMKSVCIKSCCANFIFVCGIIRTTTSPFCILLSKCLESKNHLISFFVSSSKLPSHLLLNTFKIICNIFTFENIKVCTGQDLADMMDVLT